MLSITLSPTNPSLQLTFKFLRELMKSLSSLPPCTSSILSFTSSLLSEDIPNPLYSSIMKFLRVAAGVDRETVFYAPGLMQVVMDRLKESLGVEEVSFIAEFGSNLEMRR
jgi:hypothetical protein